MFGRLLPKEGRFFDLFNQHAEQVVRAAHRGSGGPGRCAGNRDGVWARS